jgi:asparagine synthetase B (glutamine-hydrolysing)
MARASAPNSIRFRSGRTILRIISAMRASGLRPSASKPTASRKYLLSRAVRDAGYKVVITGEGSDEILGGYAHFRRDMLMYNREGQDPAALAAMLQQLGSAQPRVAAACCCRTGRANRSTM